MQFQRRMQAIVGLACALATSLALGSALGGCASAPTSGAPSGVILPAPELPILDGRSGLPMTWNGLVAAASSADAVIIGELHGHPQGLSAAADLFDAIIARRPNSTALALEFLERDEQVHLDDYLGALTDSAAFDKAIGASDASYPPGHRRMVEAARAAHRPVYAANAPRRYVRLARKDFAALSALSDEQRRLVAIPSAITEGAYKDRFFELMGGMSASHMPAGDGADDPILGMYRSQNVWDATMADTVARAITDGHAPVVLVVGQFHSDFSGGLVERLRAERPSARIMTITMQDTISATLRADDRGRADAVIYVGPSPSPDQP